MAFELGDSDLNRISYGEFTEDFLELDNRGQYRSFRVCNLVAIKLWGNTAHRIIADV